LSRSSGEPPNLKRAGIDVLLYSIAWVDDADSTWFSKELPEIARSNNFHIVGANWGVRDAPRWHGYGHSLVIGRNGKTLAQASHAVGEEIVYADLPVSTDVRQPQAAITGCQRP